MYAHNDNDPPEILIPKAPAWARRMRGRWKRAAPWAGALAAHAVLAVLFLAAIAPRGTPQPEPEAIIVTLVERPAPDLAAPAPGTDRGQPDNTQAGAAQPDAAQPGASPPVDFAVNVAPRRGGATLVLPRIPTFSDRVPPQAVAPPSEQVRQTLAAAQVCRAFAPPPEQFQASCPPIPDRSAEIQLAGLETTDFLDARLAPRDPGTAEFEVGPVVVSFTMFGSGEAPYRLTIKPRAADDKAWGDPLYGAGSPAVSAARMGVAI